MTDEKKQIGRILLTRKLISQADLDKHLERQRNANDGVPLASRIVASGTVAETDVLRALSEQFGVPGIDLNQIAIPSACLDLVPREVAESKLLLPVLASEDRLFLAMANPRDKRAIDELEFVTGRRVYPYIAMTNTIERTIREAYDSKDAGNAYFAGPAAPPSALENIGVDRRTIERMNREQAADKRAGDPRDGRGSGGQPSGARSSQDASSGERPSRVGDAAAAPSAAQQPGRTSGDRTAGGWSAEQRTGQRRGLEPIVESAGSHSSHGPSASLRPNVDARREKDSVAPGAPPVFIDTQFESAAAETDISTSDFGFLGEEVSKIARLPEELRIAAGLGPSAPTSPNGKKILVVDDDEDIRKLVRRLLTEKGHHVLEAERGLLALQLVKEETPDLLLLDAMLPELHGFDIAKRLRDSAKYGSIPILMMSAVYRGWRIAEDLKATYGIEDYIEKPFRLQELLAKVTRLLERADKGMPSADPEQIDRAAAKHLAEGIAAYKAGDIDGAIATLRKGIALDPLAYRLRYHLALLYGKQGRIYDGITELERAVDLNPKHFAALKNLGVLYEKAGFRNKAVEMWERCLHVAPDAETRESIRAHLVKLL